MESNDFVLAVLAAATIGLWLGLLVALRARRNWQRIGDAQAALLKRLDAERGFGHLLAIKQATIRELADDISQESVRSSQTREFAAKQLKLQKEKEDLARIDEEIRLVFPELFKEKGGKSEEFSSQLPCGEHDRRHQTTLFARATDWSEQHDQELVNLNRGMSL